MCEPTDMLLVPLSGKFGAGRFAMAPPKFAAEPLKFRWYCDRKGYAVRSVRSGKSIRKILMHREVWRLAGRTIPDGQELDHINGDKLDNRLCNLRPATVSQNHANSKPRGGTSRYKGVHWFKRDGKWHAAIGYNGKLVHLGYFANEIEAAKAYDKAARRLFGEYAYCNFTEGVNDASKT